MDLSKSYDFFKPEMCASRIHIIGCGSVGSTVAELLARFGLSNMTLYDFDSVEPHNLANQMFTRNDLMKNKAEAVYQMISSINEDCAANTKIATEGYVDQKLGGYVFLCVDNIELRKKIAEDNKYNMNIKAMFDFRTRLVDAQAYAANWRDTASVKAFINSMNFSHEEAKKETPVSACNVELSVAPTIRMICAAGVSNFVNFVRVNELKKLIVINAFNFEILAL